MNRRTKEIRLNRLHMNNGSGGTVDLKWCFMG